MLNATGPIEAMAAFCTQTKSNGWRKIRKNGVKRKTIGSTWFPSSGTPSTDT
jgi:hypothetical protein